MRYYDAVFLFVWCCFRICSDDFQVSLRYRSLSLFVTASERKFEQFSIIILFAQLFRGGANKQEDESYNGHACQVANFCFIHTSLDLYGSCMFKIKVSPPPSLAWGSTTSVKDAYPLYPFNMQDSNDPALSPTKHLCSSLSGSFHPLRVRPYLQMGQSLDMVQLVPVQVQNLELRQVF